MKVSLNWLKEFVSLRGTPKELSDRLSMAGFEVEEVETKGDDVVLTLGVTPNRGDALSVLGIAREVAAFQQKPLIWKSGAVPKGDRRIRDFLGVRVKDPKNCPRYMARVIYGLTIQPSPGWMQKRLEGVGIRPVNNVVDATNYVMMELGHPLHAFDHRSLTGLQIVVRSEKTPLFFVTLDGISRACQPGDLFICDEKNPVALAGIMGGANSEVRADTTTVVLEAAFFNPQRIHQTRRRLGIQSESAYRFERGVDPNGLPTALHRVTELILKTAGGEVTKDWIDSYPKKIKPTLIDLPLQEVERILGLSLSAFDLKKIFNGLGFGVFISGKKIKVTVPTFRFDLKEPIDLIEEVARTHGFDNIKATLPTLSMNIPREPKEKGLQQKAIEILTGLGFQESCHLVFFASKKIADFGLDSKTCVSLANPLSEDQDLLRPLLLPGLLKAVSFNHHRQRKDLKIFELGTVFQKEDGVSSAAHFLRESQHLGLVVSGKEWVGQWQMPAKPTDFFSLKGVLNPLSKFLAIEDFHFSKEGLPGFLVEGHGAVILLNGARIGWVGLVSPKILKAEEIEQDVFAMELEWYPIAAAAIKAKISFKAFSKFPFAERDLAVIVADGVSVQTLESAIRAEKNPWIQKVQLFDLFKGGNIPKGQKSVAFSIRYSDSKRTLTHEEVQALHERLITRLTTEFGAQLRT